MRRGLLLALGLCAALPAVAQVTDAPADDEPGFFERLFRSDNAPDDEAQGGFLERLIEDNLSGAGRQVSITGFEGALGGRATMQSLTIADDEGVWLTVTDAVLDWNRSALFRGALQVSELTAGEILLPRLPSMPESEAPTPEATGFTLPELPVSIEIGQIAAERVAIGAPVFGAEAEVSLEGAVSLVGGEGEATLAVERLDGRGALTLEAAYANASGVLALDLALDEAPDGIFANLVDLPGRPSVEFGITGEGPVDAFAADIRLATDGAERLTGQISTAAGEAEGDRRFTVDIGGDIAPVFAPDYRPFFGDAVALQAEVTRFADGRTLLEELELAAGALSLEGRALIGADALPQEIAVEGSIASADGTPVLLPLSGPETRVDRVNLQLSYDAAQSEDWQGMFRIAGLDRPGFQAEALVLDGTGRIEQGEAGGVTADLDFAARRLDFGNPDAETALGEEVTGAAQIAWAKGGDLRLSDLTVTGESYGVSGDAVVAFGETGPVATGSARVEARRLAAFSGLAGRPLSGAAEVEADFTVEPLAGTFDVDLEGESTDLAVGQDIADRILAGETELSLRAVRSEEGIVLTLRRIESDAARVSGRTELRSGGSRLSLEARLEDAATVLEDLSGPAVLTLEGTEDEERDWAVNATLDGRDLDATVGGRLTDLYETPRFDGRVEASSPDVSAFQDLAGLPIRGAVTLDAEGGLAFDLSDFALTAQATGDGFGIGQTQADRVLEGLSSARVEVAGDLERIVLDVFEVETPVLTASGQGVLTDVASAPRFEGRVEASSPDVSAFRELAGLPIRGAAAVDAEGVLAFDLSEFDLRAEVETQGLGIGQADADRLLAGRATAAVDVAGSRDEMTVRVFEFRSDELTATASGRITEGDSLLSLEARLADVSRYAGGVSGPLTVTGQVSRSGTGPFTVDLDAGGPGGSSATVDGTLAADASTADLALRGSLPLGLLNRFIEPRSVSGTGGFDLRLNGPLALSSLSGQVTAANARLVAPTLNLALEELTLNAQIDGARAQLSATAAVDGGGRVTLEGPLSLDPPYSADLTILLSRVALSDPRLYETTADGRITITGPLAGGARIAGAIELGETNIRIPSSGFGGAGAIPEIIHIAEPPPVRRTLERAGLLGESGANGDGSSAGGPVYPLDISISAPNRIFIRGRGLESEFGGSLRLTGTTANVIPIGSFDLIRGRLDILGKRLELDEARVTIQGSFEPYLDLRASTTAEEYRVNVLVTGPAGDPDITFTSNPDLPEEEVLSRLLFGRGLETLSPFQAAQLALAVRTLAGQGGEGLVSRVRDKSGLDDLDIVTNEDGSTAVRAGAYLSDNLYTDVTVDSEGETEVNLNLDLTPSVTVKGGFSNEGETSLGVFYERDY